MPDGDRLIEHAFPLRQASLDSVREKYGPRGHISGFHLWPARRPLAACRAALIATLLPDPGTPEARAKVVGQIGGDVVQATKKKRVGGRIAEVPVEETAGGVLRWGRENSPDMDFFRAEIRKAYGGRAPKVLDPFAGGGAIPLEAMRLGCEVTASDINPVAWFILKCTLEYPQELAGQTRPLPDFAVKSPEFMASYLKSTRRPSKKRLERDLQLLQSGMFPPPDADLAGHVRAWGWWVLQRAKADLERFYPTIDGSPTVAYLWARTVSCKNCRATIPLLKTLWLCKKDNKRVRLEIEPNADRTGVVYRIVYPPAVGGNAAQRREHDRRIGQGTMSRSGTWCPCCGGPGTVAMTVDDIKHEGRSGRLGAEMTAVVVEGPKGKEYRLPVPEEIEAAGAAEAELDTALAEIPLGKPTEPTPAGGGGAARAFSVQGFGMTTWDSLFTPRQLLALATFVKYVRAARDALRESGYPPLWVEAASAYATAAVDRLADHSSTLATWYLPGENVKHTFVRYALPITWDFAESNALYAGGGSWNSAVSFCSGALERTLAALSHSLPPSISQDSAIHRDKTARFDLIVTDPPYYDAIPYSDLMDYFYVWLRRSVHDLGYPFEALQAQELSPKWDGERRDGELIDDSSRFGGSAVESKANYESGMFQAFQACQRALKPDGLMVIVFAHKDPDAWETLVSAMIRAGFVVGASWPMQTENVTRSRAQASAALASSVWLVCRKRPEAARPGWDNRVLDEMQSRIYDRLHAFWDAGIRGPDFVWAATGPALEAYSKHPIVKKANEPGKVMDVSGFLRAVRRIVVEFVVGRVLQRDGNGDSTLGLDDVTIYYLLHRHDFGFEEAPVGACILYAQSCGLSDAALVSTFDLLVRTGKSSVGEESTGEADDDAGDEGSGSGSQVRLKRWTHRRSKTLGYDQDARPAPLIDRVHRLMHLWKAGDVRKVDAYLADYALPQSQVFDQLLQSLIELAREQDPEECRLLESLSNHVSKSAPPPASGAESWRQPQIAGIGDASDGGGG